MALMPRYSYQRNEAGDLEVMPLPIGYWIAIIGTIGGMMLWSFFSQQLPQEFQTDGLMIEQEIGNG